MASNAACRNLVLDAGPLLMLSPLRGLAETFITVPQRAKEHFEKLGLMAGVNVRVQSPDPTSLAHVIQFAKQTGDYSALSHADLCVLALTHALDKAEREKLAQPASSEEPCSSNHTVTNADTPPQSPESADHVEGKGTEGVSDAQGDTEIVDNAVESLEQALERLDVELVPLNEEASQPDTSTASVEATPTSLDADSPHLDASSSTPPPLYADPRVKMMMTRNQGKEIIPVGCMTADFAMQNVLLQMDLSLVGIEGKKIQKVKTWVLRCHACFKICKDASKKFCPSCGNATLLRASVTISSPSASSSAPAMQVHLKKNFQYRTRGTIYSIPAPKPGSAKTGSGEGLILREDQTEYMRAVKRAEGQRQRDEKKLLSSAIANGREGKPSMGNWMDPDWIPEIMVAGSTDRGKNSKQTDGMPTIGYGKRNPNERRRRK
ncbi:Nin one binding Zn-ribbon like-domain-containing protein [Lactifluus volemus]|nr:Nin one binding Zn-ribbon like-domain-containing protein [Lactifluus volemus]